MPNIPPPPPPPRINRPAQQGQPTVYSFNPANNPFNTRIYPVSGGDPTKDIELKVHLNRDDEEGGHNHGDGQPTYNQRRRLNNSVNYSSLRSVNEEYPDLLQTPPPTVNYYTSSPPPSPQQPIVNYPTPPPLPMQTFQPLKSSEIDAQIEFLKVELERLHRIKGNILRILKKYSRDAEKQTTLRAKLSILLLEETYLASLYTNLAKVYN